MPVIHINGQDHSLPGEPTVTEVLQALALEGKRLAVECNGSIIPRSLHQSHQLRDGDKVEIVVAVGGG